MTCEDITGGTEVEIKLYKTDDRSNEILLGTVVDSSSPFTGVGRCGFGAACMHNAGSDTSAIGVEWCRRNARYLQQVERIRRSQQVRR